MKRGLFSILLTSVLLGCNAQQNQTREITPFTKIRVSGSVNVFYTHSDTLSLVVKGQGSDMNRVETRVENSVLEISHKGSLNEPVNIYIKNKQLSHIDCGGAASFKSTNKLTGDSISLHASGSANVKLQTEIKTIKNVQSGASIVVLNGTADNLDVGVSGASALKAYNLKSRNANVTATGAATAKVFVTDTVVANAGGASDIKIKGNPADLTAETSSAASVSRIKDNTGSKKGNDTTAYNWKSKKIIVINTGEEEESEPKKQNVSADDFKHWAGISFGINGYTNPAGSINMTQANRFMELNYSRSFNLQTNLIERDFNMVKNYVKLVCGVGLDFHWYQLSNKTTLTPDSNYTWGRIDSTNAYAYKKNSLRAVYVQVPLLLEFNTSSNPNKTFHIAFGVIGQYLIGARTKQELEQDKYEITSIRKDSYNLAPFAAKAHVNLGYGAWTIFGEYSLMPLFQQGRGPELYPFAAGIRVIPFG